MKKTFLLVVLGMIFLAVGVIAQDYICEEGSDTCINNGKFNVNGDQAGVGGNMSISPIGQGCSERWSCSCVNGLTECVDENSCGSNFTIPASQGTSCGGSNNNGGSAGGGGPSGGGSGQGSPRISECVEIWQCEEWGICENDKQSRSCRDLAQCGTTVLKPKLERECDSGPKLTVGDENQKGSGILGAVLGALGNLGKSKAAAVVIFIALVVAASLIISAVRGGQPMPATPDVVPAPESPIEGKKEDKKEKK